MSKGSLEYKDVVAKSMFGGVPVDGIDEGDQADSVLCMDWTVRGIMSDLGIKNNITIVNPVDPSAKSTLRLAVAKEIAKNSPQLSENMVAKNSVSSDLEDSEYFEIIGGSSLAPQKESATGDKSSITPASVDPEGVSHPGVVTNKESQAPTQSSKPVALTNADKKERLKTFLEGAEKFRSTLKGLIAENGWKAISDVSEIPANATATQKDLLATEYALGLALYNIPAIYTLKRNEANGKVEYDLSNTTFNDSMSPGTTWLNSLRGAKNGVSAAKKISPSLKQKAFSATAPISFRVTQAAAKLLAEMDSFEQGPIDFLPNELSVLGNKVPMEYTKATAKGTITWGKQFAQDQLNAYKLRGQASIELAAKLEQEVEKVTKGLSVDTAATELNKEAIDALVDQTVNDIFVKKLDSEFGGDPAEGVQQLCALVNFISEMGVEGKKEIATKLMVKAVEYFHVNIVVIILKLLRKRHMQPVVYKIKCCKF